MNKKIIAMSIATCLLSSGAVLAETVEEKLVKMEERLQLLENRVEQQDKIIAEKDKKIAEISENSDGSGWLNSVEVGGVVEVEAQHVSVDNADDESDIYVATVELGITADVNDWTEAELVLLYEDDGSHSGDINVDVATVTIADPSANWFAKTGQYVMPFGDYSSNLISTPITADFGEMKDAAIESGFEFDNYYGSAYVFKGDQQDDIENFGINLGYVRELKNGVFTSGIGWVNDLAESNSVVDDGTAQTNKASAWTVFAKLDINNLSFVGEYVEALDSLDAYSVSDDPSAFNLEAAVSFEVLDKSSVFAIGYQGTDEASLFAGGMDEKRVLAALTVEVMDNTAFGIEYVNSEDYSGNDTDTVTGQLAVEF